MPAMIGWIATALKAEEQLKHTPRGKKEELYASIAAANNVSTTTVKRSLSALHYVRQEAPLYGVRLDEIRATVSTIEALKRISKISQEDAGSYTRSILLGERSYERVISLLNHVEFVVNDLKTFDLAEMRESACELVKRHSGTTCLYIAEEATKAARLVRPDLELVQPEAHGKLAIYFSPTWKISYFAGKSVEDLFLHSLAATSLYEIVYVIADDKIELDKMRLYSNEIRIVDPKLVLLSRAS